MKQIKSLEQRLPVLRGRCRDCFREYSDRAASSSCCSMKDSRASPGKDQRRQMSCSGLQHSTEYHFSKRRITLAQKTVHMRFEKSKCA